MTKGKKSSRKPKLITGIIIATLLVVTVFIAFNRSNFLVLNPAGEVASQQRELMVIATLLMLIVVIPVFFMTFFFAWHYREGNHKAKYRPEWSHNSLAEFTWWTVPLIIISVLGVIIWQSSHALDPYKPLEQTKKPLTVQVVALEWKWLFIYPEYNIATVNYLQIPEKTPVNFEITADAPMNSFWIPQLGGQVYAMAGMETKLHLIADKTGEYQGSSANLSGSGFSGMKFKAISSSESDFHKWVSGAQLSPERLAMDSYNELAKPSKDNLPATYALKQKDLHDKIMMKYMQPDSEYGRPPAEGYSENKQEDHAHH
jgi:cytochrome o ubiquinol oxidase subunit 2